MATVVGIRFKDAGKVYYFDPGDTVLNRGDSAIVETARGVEFDAGGIVRKVRLMVPLCVPLLVSSVRKTNSAAIAAEVRGFNLRTATSGYKEYPFVAADVAAMAGSLALVAIAVALGVLL